MDIETRLARLELSNRRLKLACVSLLAVGIAGWHFGAGPTPDAQEVVRAKRIEVVDAAGRAVIMLDSTQNPAGPLIQMFGKSDKPVVVLGSISDNGVLIVQDATGKLSTEINELSDCARLQVGDNETRQSVTLSGGSPPNQFFPGVPPLIRFRAPDGKTSTLPAN